MKNKFLKNQRVVLSMKDELFKLLDSVVNLYFPIIAFFSVCAVVLMLSYIIILLIKRINNE